LPDGSARFRDIKGGSRINNNGQLNPYPAVNFSGINWRSDRNEAQIHSQIGKGGRSLLYYDISGRGDIRRSDITNSFKLERIGTSSNFQTTFHFNTGAVGYSYRKNISFMSGMSFSSFDYLRVTLVFDHMYRVVEIRNEDRYAVSMMGSQWSRVSLMERVRYDFKETLSVPTGNGNFIF